MASMLRLRDQLRQ
jgi:hypothetical protein